MIAINRTSYLDYDYWTIIYFLFLYTVNMFKVIFSNERLHNLIFVILK